MASSYVSPRSTSRVMIFFDHPESFLPQLQARFPDVAFSACTSYEKLPVALAECAPQVVFGFKFEPKPFPRTDLLCSQGLEWLSVAFAGIDGVVPWNEDKLVVTNASGVAATEMGHYAIAAILGCFQGFPASFANQARHKWQYRVNRSARGATLGIVGLGRSGREIARMARAVGLRVVACRTRAEPSPDVETVYPTEQLHEMLRAVDVTVVCAPLTASTQDLFDQPAFAAMKPGAYFINIARGAIVKEQPLIDALVSGHLAGAVLDVVRTEPLPSSSPLWDVPNLLITPHSSSEYDGWVEEAVRMFADNLERWIAGTPLENRVRSGRGY